MSKIIAIMAIVAAVATAASIHTAAAPRFVLQPAHRAPVEWHVTNKATAAPEKFSVMIGLQRRNLDAMDKTFWDVSTPGSSTYGEHLNNNDMTALVSPGKAVVEKVVAWLKSHGATKVAVSRHEDSLRVSELSEAQIEALFGVRFATYKSGVTMEVKRRALGDITIPREFQGMIQNVGGFRGFPMHQKIARVNAKDTQPKPTFVDPAVLYQAYNISLSTYAKTPAGKTNIQSFFQAQGQYVRPEDLSEFCREMMKFPEFDAKDCKIDKYVGKNLPGQPGVESSLDSEYIMATGFGLDTWVYTNSKTDFCSDLLDWAQQVFEQSEDYPKVISMSYGSQELPPYCDQATVKRLTEDIQKMGTMGISVIIASGDSGSAEVSRGGYNYGLLYNSFPSNIPYCTSVGATAFVNGGKSGEEMATTQFGSGGGFAYEHARPAYQAKFVEEYFRVGKDKLPPTLSYNHTTRGTPDVAALGEGYVVVTNGANMTVGGTSCSTPVFSGMIARLNNARLEKGKTLGFLNPFLYANPQAFNDIVKGSNDVNKDGMGWYAAKGWDAVTGLGTPNFGKLLDLVRSLP